MATKLPVLPSSQQRAVQAPAGVLDPLYYFFLSQLLEALVDRTRMVVKTGAPAASDVPDGEFRVWKNTTDSTVKLYANDGGVLVETTLT